jgi:phosphotriesterase-related protein
MEGEFFRTVLGDLPTDKMGLCYSHEHIVIEESFPTCSNPQFLLNDTAKISEELIGFHQAGGRTVVDTMPANCGRNVVKLAKISGMSNVNIIAPTGIHLEQYYLPNHWRYHYTSDQLAQLFIADVQEGIDMYDYGGPIVTRTPHKAGMIKLATGDDPITAHQEKIFDAVSQAHLATGAPILTHTNFGRHADRQVELFLKYNVDLSHVVLSHVDRFKDIQYHKDLLSAGVYLEYDSAFRWKEEENWTYKLLEELLPLYPTQIVMGMDMAKNIYWRSYNGSPGLNFLIDRMPEVLSGMGLAHLYQNIFFINPARLYAFKI